MRNLGDSERLESLQRRSMSAAPTGAGHRVYDSHLKSSAGAVEYEALEFYRNNCDVVKSRSAEVTPCARWSVLDTPPRGT